MRRSPSCMRATAGALPLRPAWRTSNGGGLGAACCGWEFHRSR